MHRNNERCHTETKQNSKTEEVISTNDEMLPTRYNVFTLQYARESWRWASISDEVRYMVLKTNVKTYMEK